jgi:hypothetical protein
MSNSILTGMAAGAVGTVALNVATYVDMAVRARPSSSTPSQMVGAMAEKAGVQSLSSQGGGLNDETAENRKSGLGALSGYVVGLGVGAAYGLLRSRVRQAPLPVSTIGLSLAAMAGSDVPIAALGVSDPRTWTASDWVADLGPHLAYGLFTALAYDAFAVNS